MTPSLKTLAVLALLTSGGCATSSPARDTEADKAKLQADATSWFDFYAQADGPGMANLYADDAVLMPPGALSVTGRAGIGAYLGEDAAKTKAAGLSIKNGTVTGVDVSGDSGWISGSYTVVDASGGTVDSGHYLSVHHLTNGTWLYVRDIWNSDRAPAPAPAPATK
jgi:ketosteroid isomerase-like protein